MAGSDATEGGFAWYPSESFKRQSNWAAFIAAENLADYPMLERKAAQDPEWFWDALIRFLGVQFAKPYSRVLDPSKGSSGRNGASARPATSRCLCSTVISSPAAAAMTQSFGKARTQRAAVSVTGNSQTR